MSPDSQFGDDDVMAVGPVVDKLAAEFADYWSSPVAVPAEHLRRDCADAASLAHYRNELNAFPHQCRHLYHRIGDYAVQFDQRLQAGEPRLARSRLLRIGVAVGERHGLI